MYASASRALLPRLEDLYPGIGFAVELSSEIEQDERYSPADWQYMYHSPYRSGQAIEAQKCLGIFRTTFGFPRRNEQVNAKCPRKDCEATDTKVTDIAWLSMLRHPFLFSSGESRA